MSMDRVIEKKKWPLRKILFIAFWIIFGTWIIYLLFFRTSSSKLYVETNHLRIVKVEKGAFEEFIPLDGLVLPIKTLMIDAVQGGFVEEVFVEDGAILEKGDTLLKLSNANLELDFINRESQMYDVINNLQNSLIRIDQNAFLREKEIVDLEYQLDLKAIDLKRKRGFYKDELISDEEFENAKRDFEYFTKQKDISIALKQIDSLSGITQKQQITSSINRMRNNLVMLKRNLESLYVKAGINGQLTSFNIEIGETVSAGENLGNIDVMDSYKIRANVDQRYITRVFTGQEAEFTFNTQVYNVEISKVYTQVRNGSFRIDLTFPNDIPAEIKRGQSVQLRLKFSRSQDAIFIKKGGFFQSSGGNYIYVLNNDNTASKRSINIGRQNAREYEILEGLQPGEQVIISSYDNFGDKDLLILED